jgi:cobalt-zinc-cadmium efflux system outer membrane protein
VWADTDPEETKSSEQLPAPEEPTGALSLEQAVMLALLKNPEIKAFSLEIRVLEARALQAGFLPNPELELETENFGGEGDLRDFDSVETTIKLSQVMELAGKRSKRKRLASLERDLGEWNYKVKRADVLARDTRAFVAALAAQEQVALKQETLDLAKQVLNAVAERVRAGKVSALEETRANVSYARYLIELERAKHRLEAARKGLASLWGNRNPRFKELSGRLDQIRPIPSFQDLHTTDNPEIARWGVEIEQREAAVRLEKAGRVPNVTLGGGWRHFEESDDEAFVMSLSVPLPLFDRNQGGIQEARQRLLKVTEEKRSVELNVSNALSEAYEALSTAYIEASALKEKVLPGAQRTFDATQEGYRLGKFDYLRMLDAQQTLFEVRDQYIEALAAYHKGIAEVERLIGVPMHAVMAKRDQNSEGVNAHE